MLSITGGTATEDSADPELIVSFPLVSASCVLYLLRCVPLFWKVIHTLFADSKKIQ
jgi:hypothetical protein